MGKRRKLAEVTLVRIGAFDFTVSQQKELSQFGAAGITNSDNQMIAIDPSLADEQVKETLLHEVMHACWKQTSLRTRFPDEDRESPGELIIEDLSPLLYAFIKDNPEIIKWMMEA